MRTRGIQSGFGFLAEPAGFDIGETMFRYESVDSYWRAFAIGVFNTLRVAVIGVILTTLLGTLIGVGRFSRNALVRGLCYGYVETFRNIPVLLQLLMWYILFTEVLPPIADAIALAPGVFVSKSGMSFPLPVWEAGHAFAFLGLLAGLCAAWWYRRWARSQFEETGRIRSMALAPVGIALASAAVGWLAGGAPVGLEMPVKGEVIIEGGGMLTPEFIAVLLGLVVYTAAFVAEVVRSGIQSVPHGQNEAARALGLARGHEMRLVVLPQALRVIIPPMTNQFLNLTKNSSLAVAIGYPDVVSIGNTAINQTGRAVECIAIIMAVYLTLSLLTSLFMNWFNKHAAIKER
jgi:general L-amino acid transport system permease protein